MNRGLFAKTFRETWPTALLVGLGMLAFKTLLAFIAPQIAGQMGASMLQMDFVRNILKALLGSEIGDVIDPASFGAFAWVHPVILALLWAQEITFCTRLPAGEVDRGTVDVLLGLPVSRWQLYVCDSLMWLFWGAAIIAVGWVGDTLGGWAAEEGFRPPASKVVPIVVNLYCVYVAVGGLAWLVSALSDRRGRAIAVVFGIVVGSFALSFLAQFWGPARSISWIGLLHYYQPLGILQSESWPWRNMAVLTVFGGVCWVIGGLVFARRDIRTV